jgi:hypothetical protein
VTARFLGSVGVAVAVAVLTAAPAAAARGPVVDKVLVLALPGVSWADLRGAGPNLQRVLAAGSLASLSVRGVGSTTSRADGYLMIGAGNRAALPESAGGSSLAAMMAAARHQADADYYDAEPGALGDALARAGRATAVIGDDETALAVADGSGRLGTQRAWPVPAADVAAVVGAASVVVAEVPSGSGLGAADADIGNLLGTVDLNRDLVLVVAPTFVGSRPELTAFAAAGPGFGGTWARSATTRRPGYVTLPDVGVTILTALGVAVPDVMNATAVTAGASLPSAPIESLVRANERAVYRDRAVGPVSVPFVVLGVLVGLVAVALPALVGRTGPDDRASVPFSSNRYRFDEKGVRATAVVVLAVPSIAFASGLLRYDRLALGLYVVGVFAAAIVLAAVASLLGARRGATALVGLIWFVLVADILTGGHLQIDTVFGYSPIVAGRFQGFGNVAFALLGQAALVLAAAVLVGRDPTTRRRRVLVVAALLALTVLVDGAPMFGSDVGGVLASVPAFALVVLAARGRRIDVRRVAMLAAGTAAVVVALAAVDLARPATSRTHLGRFAHRVLNGEAGSILHRKLAANWAILTSSPWTLLVPVVVIGFAVLALGRRGPLASLIRARPDLRTLVVASLVMAAIGFAVNDSGIVVPALQLTVLGPWLVVVLLTPGRETAGQHTSDQETA